MNNSTIKYNCKTTSFFSEYSPRDALSLGTTCQLCYKLLEKDIFYQAYRTERDRVKNAFYESPFVKILSRSMDVIAKISGGGLNKIFLMAKDKLNQINHIQGEKSKIMNAFRRFIDDQLKFDNYFIERLQFVSKEATKKLNKYDVKLNKYNVKLNKYNVKLVKQLRKEIPNLILAAGCLLTTAYLAKEAYGAPNCYVSYELPTCLNIETNATQVVGIDNCSWVQKAMLFMFYLSAIMIISLTTLALSMF